ncbi:MAG TPA: transporter substrate-binding domain-containing protein [Anaerolineales bacterium]|nr:transporter substrate-binding domain-containing protein [Anaerolineales bacterium]
MKKLIPLLLLALLGILTLTACGGKAAPTDLLDEIVKRGSIRVSTDPNYEPQSFLDGNGNYVGFDIDVATEIAKRLGVEIEFVTPNWDLITAGNWGGQWDMSVGSMTITKDRQQVLDFANPAYYYSPAQFAAATSANITSLDQINGQAVCMGSATTYESWLKGNDLGLSEGSYFAEPPTGTSVVTLPTDNECMQALQAGRTEFSVVLTSKTVVDAAIANGIPVIAVGKPVYAEQLAAAFDKNSQLSNASLVAKVSEILQAMHDDGTLKGFSEKWFDGVDLTVDPTK